MVTYFEVPCFKAPLSGDAPLQSLNYSNYNNVHFLALANCPGENSLSTT